MKYDNNHWQELITTIIDRIGADAFLRLSAAVLKANNHAELAHEMKDLADEYTRQGDEEWPTTEGRDIREQMYQAEEAMKLKR